MPVPSVYLDENVDVELAGTTSSTSSLAAIAYPATANKRCDSRSVS